MYKFQKEVESCIDCNLCWDVCPVNRIKGGDVYTPQGKIMSLAKVVAGEELSKEEMDNIYLSTRCGACDDICPSNIPITDIIQYERQLLEEQGREPQMTTGIAKNIMELNSPGGMDRSKRFDWVSDDLILDGSSDTAYMTGCWIAYSQPEIARATIRLLNHAGIEPRLIDEERCCGFFLIDNGHFEQARERAKEFVEHIESLGIKKVIASCPGCLITLRDHYAELYREPAFEVVYSLDLFNDMVKDGVLEPNPLDITVSIRDACPLREIKHVPRELVRSTGAGIEELFDGEHVCCGGPAGLKPNFPETSAEIAMLSVKDYKQRSDALISYCPFCKHHIGGVCASSGEELDMRDVSVLLAESVLGKDAAR